MERKVLWFKKDYISVKSPSSFQFCNPIAKQLRMQPVYPSAPLQQLQPTPPQPINPSLSLPQAPIKQLRLTTPQPNPYQPSMATQDQLLTRMSLNQSNKSLNQSNMSLNQSNKNLNQSNMSPN